MIIKIKTVLTGLMLFLFLASSFTCWMLYPVYNVDSTGTALYYSYSQFEVFNASSIVLYITGLALAFIHIKDLH